MGIPIMIGGRSGAGKSTSLRNLDPLTYSVIEVNGKPLPFKTKKKSIVTDDYAKVSRVLNEAPTDIIIIDDSQYLMANEFMRRAREKGYEKFSEIGQNFWNLVNEATKLPPNKVVYFLHHIETDEYGVSKEKTIGKMLDDKICLAGMFTIFLLAEKVDDKYLFDTQNDGRSPAKSPIGMFTERTMDNDLAIVDKAVRAFYDLPEPFRMEEPKA